MKKRSIYAAKFRLKMMGEYTPKSLIQFKQFIGRPLWIAMKANMTEEELAFVERTFRAGRTKFFFPVIAWSFAWIKSNESWDYWDAMYDRIRDWELDLIAKRYEQYREDKEK